MASNVGMTTPPESETELANAPTPDTASGAIAAGGATSSAKQTTTAAAGTNDELLRKLQSQVEFYFSSQNLQNDPYLVSQMNGEKYVPISLITSFPKIAILTTDPLLLSLLSKDFVTRTLV